MKKRVQNQVVDHVDAIRQRVDKTKTETLTAVESLYKARLALAELRELALELEKIRGEPSEVDPILQTLMKESFRLRETLQSTVNLVLDELILLGTDGSVAGIQRQVEG